jgi:hypothetical protein|tara:strand:- start:4488 stop:5402 length:915 start_codon:yes stop_codon:yes gene_type:complete
MNKRRPELSKEGLRWLGAVLQVLDKMKNYWPLTLRQVHYQLVAAEVVENHLSQYKKLSRVLTQARLQGLLPWVALEDRHRETLQSGGWEDKESFMRQEKRSFLAGYRRDLLQEQSVALEIWIEKDALSRIAHQAALPYCVPVVVARGFGSVSYVKELRERIANNWDWGKDTIILYFGDMDPSGYEMLPSMMQTLREDMGCGNEVQEVRCALTPELIQEYSLPHSPEALKWSDSRAQKYVRKFGELAVELDALPPDALEQLVRKSIEEHLDLDILEEQRGEEQVELEELESIRARALATLEEGDE